ncbi:ECF transporter S component [Clostridium tunisiense]|uniref:ECF transporter S component n=1 Tax=Clostridium tunisiense TaxID=219748 RepID=UPI0002F0759F|nr:ECF transporter S component [Clostridium tunisiense]
MKSNFNIKKLVLLALFVALSFVGANIKIFGSIAFDAMPAYFATILMGPVSGAIVAVIGHLFTALLSGFPLSLPVHLIISVNMAITMAATFYAYKFLRKNGFFIAAFVAIIVGTLFNGPISTLVLLPILGDMVYGLIPILTVVSAINVLLAFMVYYFMPTAIKEKYNANL